MSIAKYSNYKKTIERWVTHIPDHWHMLSGKRLFSNIRVRALKTDEQLAASQAYGVIPQSLMIKKNDAKVMLALKGTESFRHVDKNDFVISLRSFEGGIEHSEYTGCVSPAYTVLKPKEFCSPEYFRHLLKSNGFISALQSTTDSLRDGKSISYEQFGSITLPCPPLKDQTKIAEFLDYETAKIDALIDEQKRLIELLKEKRQAVISHAVTKGLTPDAPMKDSGVEWLGEVPEHWSIVKLSYVLFLRSGDSITSASIEESGDYPVYGGNGLRGYTNKYNHSGKYNLIGRQGALCGNINFATGKFYASEHAVVCRPLKQVDVRYFYYLLTQMNLGQYSVSAAQPGISVDRINQLKLAIPPIEEQNMIASKLDLEIKTQEQTANEAQDLIKLLSERRSALISAAVTGKIDVRDWQPPAGSDTVDSNMSMQTERHYG